MWAERSITAISSKWPINSQGYFASGALNQIPKLRLSPLSFTVAHQQNGREKPLAISLPSPALGFFLQTSSSETESMAEDPTTTQTPSPSTNPLGHAVIPIVNKLQDIFAQLGSSSTIDLPQVAVIGSQSSGKSSVLEALVGRDFLPRGSDICTRRPLVLQLVHTPRKGEEGEDAEWGEFLHVPGKKFFDFAAIRREIQAETEREAGGNKGVSDRQIRLKVFSPNVLNITLVDLPGITKVPVGDQPHDIELRIRTMILSYIKHETCIILAVTPANADLANSDALQMARVADPDGTDARDFLTGKIVPLKLGYVGVVNRSQEDIIQNRSIKEALAYEEDFFRRNAIYHGLSDRCGIPQLAKKLNQILTILVQHIKTVLPGLKARISSQLVAVAKEHATYGEITESKEVDPCDDLTDDDIRTAIHNATGLKGALFVPEVPFELLVRRQIARLLDPSLQCARFIYDELIKMSHRCMANELQRFPFLRKRMDEVVGNFLREGLEPSETIIRHLIAMEMDYINTSHPNFIGGSKALEIATQQIKCNRTPAAVPKLKDGIDSDRTQSSEKSGKSRAILARSGANGIAADQPPAILRPSESHSETESVEIAITKLLLKSYYDIVRKNIEDSIPKAIMHFLVYSSRGNIRLFLHLVVNHTKRELHNVFIRKLYRENLFEDMLQEPEEISAKRKRTRETLRVLQQALRVLEELPLEAETVTKGYGMAPDSTGLPRVQGLPSFYSSTDFSSSYTSSPKNPRLRKSSHSGEQPSSLHSNLDVNGGGYHSGLGSYPVKVFVQGTSVHLSKEQYLLCCPCLLHRVLWMPKRWRPNFSGYAFVHVETTDM
ncbi:hypothetical protein ACLOJK_003130 [Asimina triloba]